MRDVRNLSVRACGTVNGVARNLCFFEVLTEVYVIDVLSQLGAMRVSSTKFGTWHSDAWLVELLRTVASDQRSGAQHYLHVALVRRAGVQQSFGNLFQPSSLLITTDSTSLGERR